MNTCYNRLWLDHDLCVDLEHAHIFKQGRMHMLSAMESTLLYRLSLSLDCPVSMEELVHWSYAADTNGDYGIETVILQLHQYLGDDSKREIYLFSVHGYGYLLHSLLRQ